MTFTYFFVYACACACACGVYGVECFDSRASIEACVVLSSRNASAIRLLLRYAKFTRPKHILQLPVLPYLKGLALRLPNTHTH